MPAPLIRTVGCATAHSVSARAGSLTSRLRSRVPPDETCAVPGRQDDAHVEMSCPVCVNHHPPPRLSR